MRGGLGRCASDQLLAGPTMFAWHVLHTVLVRAIVQGKGRSRGRASERGMWAGRVRQDMQEGQVGKASSSLVADMQVVPSSPPQSAVTFDLSPLPLLFALPHRALDPSIPHWPSTTARAMDDVASVSGVSLHSLLRRRRARADGEIDAARQDALAAAAHQQTRPPHRRDDNDDDEDNDGDKDDAEELERALDGQRVCLDGQSAPVRADTSHARCATCERTRKRRASWQSHGSNSPSAPPTLSRPRVPSSSWRTATTCAISKSSRPVRGDTKSLGWATRIPTQLTGRC